MLYYKAYEDKYNFMFHGYIFMDALGVWVFEFNAYICLNMKVIVRTYEEM